MLILPLKRFVKHYSIWSQRKAPVLMAFPRYQKSWSIVGEKLVSLVKDALVSGCFNPELNKTLLILITKVEEAERVSQFRPISLCTVPIKLITKVLVNRIRPLLGKLVGKNQRSFIPLRKITDNILAVQESLHTMRKMKRKKVSKG